MRPIAFAFIFLVCHMTRFITGEEVLDSFFSHGLDPDTKDPEKLIIVDTDVGIDDAFAIFTLLGYEKSVGNVKTVMLTTVHGNTDVYHVTKNVLKVLKTADRLDIPIYQGLNESLMTTPWNNYFFGRDGFGDYEDVDPELLNLVKKEHAVNALVEAVSKNPGKLTLVCLGPLTNVAMAAKMDPTFLKNLKEIFVLGGSDSGVGNIIPGVEFNFYMDPDAVYVVLKGVEEAGKKITLVTWETVSRRSKIHSDWRKNVLGAIKSPAMDLMNKIEEKYMQGEFWECADPILLSILLDENLAETVNEYRVDVETCGKHSRGAIFVDYECNKTFVKNARIVERINIDLYKEFLLKNFKNEP